MKVKPDLPCSNLLLENKRFPIRKKIGKTEQNKWSSRSVIESDRRQRKRRRRIHKETERGKGKKSGSQAARQAEMVFNSLLVVSVANLSADLCQYIACNPQRLSSRHVLHLICCLPLQQLGRLALCLCSFFCFPPPDSHYYSSSDSSSSDDDDDYDSDDSHSD